MPRFVSRTPVTVYRLHAVAYDFTSVDAGEMAIAFAPQIGFAMFVV